MNPRPSPSGRLVPPKKLGERYEAERRGRRLAGWLTDVYIDDSAYYDPSGGGEPDWSAALRIHHVQYTFADDGQPLVPPRHDSR